MLPVNCAKTDPQANNRNAARTPSEQEELVLAVMFTPQGMPDGKCEKTFTAMAHTYNRLPLHCQEISSGFALDRDLVERADATLPSCAV